MSVSNLEKEKKYQNTGDFLEFNFRTFNKKGYQCNENFIWILQFRDFFLNLQT